MEQTRRVVVTGLGVISPVGNTVDECWNNLKNGVHGTGTPMNDSLETKVVKLALGEEEAKKAYMSSTKSMTGHMLGAAGAVEAIACLKALNESILPPTINLLDPDPACDLNNVPNVAIHADVDLVLSNSLGFGGHNACIAFRKVTK